LKGSIDKPFSQFFCYSERGKKPRGQLLTFSKFQAIMLGYNEKWGCVLSYDHTTLIELGLSTTLELEII
jgi:hypothetical protein